MCSLGFAKACIVFCSCLVLARPCARSRIVRRRSGGYYAGDGRREEREMPPNRIQPIPTRRKGENEEKRECLPSDQAAQNHRT